MNGFSKIFCIDLTARQKRYFFIFHVLIFDDFVTAFAKNLNLKLFVLLKRKDHCNVSFNGTYKMFSCHLF